MTSNVFFLTTKITPFYSISLIKTTKIQDPRFISIINALLKVKVQEEGKRAQNSKIGTHQGSIISPLLSNIILLEFDLFMVDYFIEFNKGKARKTNPEYRRAYRNRKYEAKAARIVGYSDFLDKNLPKDLLRWLCR